MMRFSTTIFLCLATTGLGQMSSYSFSSEISFSSDEDGSVHKRVREVHSSSVGDGLVEHQMQSKMACEDGRCIEATGKRIVPLLARPRSSMMEIIPMIRQPRFGRSQMPAMKLIPLLSRPRLEPELSLLSRPASIMDQMADQSLPEGRVVESVPLLQLPFMNVLQELATDESESDAAQQPGTEQDVELLDNEQQAADVVPPPKPQLKVEQVSNEKQVIPAVTEPSTAELKTTPMSNDEKQAPAAVAAPKAEPEELASDNKKTTSGSHGDFFNFIKDMMLPESKPEVKKDPEHAADREEFHLTDV